MKEVRLYYTPPDDDQFDDMKLACARLWYQIADHIGYAHEKVERIINLQNIRDNFMYMLAMFDMNNQRKIAERLSADTLESVNERLLDGGSDYTL